MKSWDELSFFQEGRDYKVFSDLDRKVFYPPFRNWFRALQETPFDQVSVVILGQDPYPTPGVATGLAFSVSENVKKLPPTLRNIFTEYTRDLHHPWPRSGDLTPWTRQGVLLLNTALTVAPYRPGSHKGVWEALTNEILDKTSQSNAVHILWGMDARTMFGSRGGPKITSSHPSPLSAHRGFFGSRPFSTCNGILAKLNREPINWKLP